MPDPVVDIRGLSFTYHSGKKALDGIDLTVARGECLALIGPNGAGKSTLLLHLNGILRGRGTIRILGLEMIRANLKTIRSRVGLVFQDSRQQLFLPTVAEDIAFGPLNAGIPASQVQRSVERIMDLFALRELGTSSPLRLSPGEQKKAALASVLVMEPELLAFDEPSAGLDPAGRRDFIELLRTLPQTKIIATHDMELACQLCSRALILDQGRIFADGPAREILTDRDLLEAHRLEVPLSLQLGRTGESCRLSPKE